MCHGDGPAPWTLNETLVTPKTNTVRHMLRMDTHSYTTICISPRLTVITIINDKCLYSLLSLAFLPSRSVEERASTRDRSGLAVEINAVIYYGKVETYAERACVRAGVCVCVCGRERERERGEKLTGKERETPGDNLLLRAALPLEWEVSSTERTRSVRHSLIVANPALSLCPTARLSVRNKKRRTWRIREDGASPAPEWGNGSTWPIRKRNRGRWILFIRSPSKTAQPEQRGRREEQRRLRRVNWKSVSPTFLICGEATQKSL